MRRNSFDSDPEQFIRLRPRRRLGSSECSWNLYTDADTFIVAGHNAVTDAYTHTNSVADPFADSLRWHLYKVDVNRCDDRSRNDAGTWKQLRRLLECDHVSVPGLALRTDLHSDKCFIERQSAVRQF